MSIFKKLTEKIKGTSNTPPDASRPVFNYQPIVNSHPQRINNSERSGIFSNIPTEVFELLYIADGKYKNYSSEAIRPVNQSFETANGANIYLAYSGTEPSAIFTNLPVAASSAGKKPPYFPRYTELSDRQRRGYLDFLADPFSGSHDVGYAFLFYYGLERQLLTGKTEKAFKMILKLREKYPSKSFRRYSANALWGICALKQKTDLAVNFVSDVADHIDPIDFRLFSLIKYSFKMPVTPEEIVTYANDVGFTNMPYLKRHKEDFIYEIVKVLINEYGEKCLIIENAPGRSEMYEIQLFANRSLFGNTIELPDYSYIVGGEFLKILSAAHINIRGGVPGYTPDTRTVKYRFDMERMIQPRPEHNIYFFPLEYYAMVRNDILSLNEVIEKAEQLCNITIPLHIEKRNIRVKPDNNECYYFSVMEYTPFTSTGKHKKYPQCVTVFVYEDMDKKSYWNGQIFYDQKGAIGKGNLIYHVVNTGDGIMSYHITFSEKMNIKKVSKVLRSGGQLVQLYP